MDYKIYFDNNDSTKKDEDNKKKKKKILLFALLGAAGGAILVTSIATPIAVMKYKALPKYFDELIQNLSVIYDDAKPKIMEMEEGKLKPVFNQTKYPDAEVEIESKNIRTNWVDGKVFLKATIRDKKNPKKTTLSKQFELDGFGAFEIKDDDLLKGQLKDHVDDIYTIDEVLNYFGNKNDASEINKKLKEEFLENYQEPKYEAKVIKLAKNNNILEYKYKIFKLVPSAKSWNDDSQSELAKNGELNLDFKNIFTKNVNFLYNEINNLKLKLDVANQNDLDNLATKMKDKNEVGHYKLSSIDPNFSTEEFNKKFIFESIDLDFNDIGGKLLARIKVKNKRLPSVQATFDLNIEGFKKIDLNKLELKNVKLKPFSQDVKLLTLQSLVNFFPKPNKSPIKFDDWLEFAEKTDPIIRKYFDFEDEFPEGKIFAYFHSLFGDNEDAKYSQAMNQIDLRYVRTGEIANSSRFGNHSFRDLRLEHFAREDNKWVFKPGQFTISKTDSNLIEESKKDFIKRVEEVNKGENYINADKWSNKIFNSFTGALYNITKPELASTLFGVKSGNDDIYNLTYLPFFELNTNDGTKRDYGFDKLFKISEYGDYLDKIVYPSFLNKDNKLNDYLPNVEGSTIFDAQANKLQVEVHFQIQRNDEKGWLFIRPEINLRTFWRNIKNTEGQILNSKSGYMRKIFDKNIPLKPYKIDSSKWNIKPNGHFKEYLAERIKEFYPNADQTLQTDDSEYYIGNKHIINANLVVTKKDFTDAFIESYSETADKRFESLIKSIKDNSIFTPHSYSKEEGICAFLDDDYFNKNIYSTYQSEFSPRFVGKDSKNNSIFKLFQMQKFGGLKKIIGEWRKDIYYKDNERKIVDRTEYVYEDNIINGPNNNISSSYYYKKTNIKFRSPNKEESNIWRTNGNLDKAKFKYYLQKSKSSIPNSLAFWFILEEDKEFYNAWDSKEKDSTVEKSSLMFENISFKE